MAFLSENEKYLTFKGFPELVAQIAAGDGDITIKFKAGTAVSIADDQIGVLLELADTSSMTGCKNPNGVTKICWRLFNSQEKKYMKDTVKVSRLERCLFRLFVERVGKWFSGEIIVTCGQLLFNQFEAADPQSDIAKQLLGGLVSCVLRELATPAFEVPSASKSVGGTYQSRPAESEADKLKARLDLYKDACAVSYAEDFWGAASLPSTTIESEKKRTVAQMAIFQLVIHGKLDTAEIIKLADYLFG